MSESTATGTEPGPEAPGTPAATGPSTTEAPATEPAPSVPAVPAVPAVSAAAAEPGARSRRRRHALRAVARWTAAVAVFGVLGTGVAYGIAEQERTDLAGLATESDGRWDYPELALPPLPAGAPRPFAEENVGKIHHVDVRDLLLTPPEGAVGDESLPSIDGVWVSPEDFAKIYTKGDRADVEQRLVDDAVRHIAARGWVMPDGTRTSVHLLQFNSTMYPFLFFVEEIAPGVAPTVSVVGSREAEVDASWPSDATVPDVDRYAFDEVKPRGDEHVRQAYLIAGDTLAVVVQSREGTAHTVPFQQTVILQSQLLG